MKYLLLALLIAYLLAMRWMARQDKPKYPELGTWRERFNAIGRSRHK